MNSLCVFCGASPGRGDEHLDAARAVGRLLAKRRITLIFGGGSVGMMGAVANATLRAGGRAVGVIPKFLWDKEVGHRALSDLFIVETMHERKAKMAELADAFLVLPGGLGTLEEFFEVWTWGNLGLHAKPIGILNVGGYYDGLLGAVDAMIEQGFVNPDNRKMLRISSQPEDLIEDLCTDLPAGARWMEQASA